MGTFRCDDRVESMHDRDLAHLERAIVETLLEDGRLLVTVVDEDGGRPVRLAIDRSTRLQFDRIASVEVDEHRVAIMRRAARDQASLLVSRAR